MSSFHVESLSDLPQMDLVLDLQRALSVARSEAELITSFAPRFGQLSGAHRLLDLDTAGLPDGEFRLRNVIPLGDPSFTIAEARAANRWKQPKDALPPRRSAALSPLLADPSPKRVRALDSALDGELLGTDFERQDALAVPVYHAGELTQWLVVLAPAGNHVEENMLRAAIGNLNLFSRALAQFRLHEEVGSLKARLELGLSEVARIQRSILPDLPRVSGAEIAVHYRPSALAGGDYYDFRSFPDGRLGVMIADVAGHGPGAAVVMAMMRTIMSAYRLGHDSPNSVVPFTNRLLADGLTRGTFVTAIFVVLDTQTGQGFYSNCGHCHPLLLHRGGRVETLAQGGSPPLGILPDIEAGGGEFRLAEGEGLLLHTDGVTDAPAAGGDGRFGPARLERVLAGDDSPATAMERLGRALDAFSGDTPRRDDECALMLRRVASAR